MCGECRRLVLYGAEVARGYIHCGGSLVGVWRGSEKVLQVGVFQGCNIAMQNNDVFLLKLASDCKLCVC